MYHKFFTPNFYIAHWQHVDLLCSSYRNKETFNPSFNLPDIRKQLVIQKRCFGKKVFLLSDFNLCKTSVKSSYYSKLAGFFPPTFANFNTVRGIFQGFYLDLKSFLLYAILAVNYYCKFLSLKCLREPWIRFWEMLIKVVPVKNNVYSKQYLFQAERLIKRPFSINLQASICLFTGAKFQGSFFLRHSRN